MFIMVLSTNLGFPRIGADRELKKAVEAYWKGQFGFADLQKTAAELRIRHWKLQKVAGLSHIPSNDFSFYDHVLDTSALLGCIPARYNWDGKDVTPDLYFAMARGNDKVPAMEMVKWFDTNYHYMVPEFVKGQKFKLSSTKIFDEYSEAKAAGIETRPVLLGPVSYLTLGKRKEDNTAWGMMWENLMPVYEQIISKLVALGAEWIQIDEPCLTTSAWEGHDEVYKVTFERLAKAAGSTKILLATYFEGLNDNLDLVLSLPVQAVHIDLRRAPDQLDKVLAKVPADKILSLGIVDGRNIWKNDLSASLGVIEKAVAKLGKDRVFIAPSCSMLHTPIDLTLEDKLDPQIKSWMAYATQKLDEIAILAKGANEGRDAIKTELAASDKVAADRKISPRIHDQAVQKRMAAITPDMSNRKSSFAARQKRQQDALSLPAFPTTSIGSFPQTEEIRKARAAFKKGALSETAYTDAMKKEIAQVVAWQEEIGVDVLVHGEPERNDMVEYFGEQLAGFTFSKNGWVQSYGSRCVKPPIIYGDVSRPKPMTVEWSAYAQSLTDKPMKGMLTGPITILCWSFVRDDQPRSQTCKQIALAIRDEVQDLEKAGITIIQIDEPAIREGLPLRRQDWDAYLKWAVDCFKLSTTGVEDTTQIHTHMCYSEFNDIIHSIGALDADVISIETSRSQMKLLDAFVAYKYPNEIGPGVWDIHSPRVPSTDEMQSLLQKAAQVIDPSQIWVNPDCGLKTRGWAEVKPAMQHMVDAAKAMRQKLRKAA
jgi:5-methyltetrahydropteroyltriglutamate--homocysteine methyltransferase